MEKARLFLAVELDRGLCERLAAVTETLSARLSGIRWVSPERMHITVKFFGSIALDLADRIDTAVRPVLAHRRQFELEAAHLGVFPNTRRPSVIWVDVTRGADKLSDLAEGTVAALARHGFEDAGRAFVPHITLGRVKRGRRLPRAAVESTLADFAHSLFGRSFVTHMTLFSSNLTPDGPVYTEVASWPLSQ